MEIPVIAPSEPKSAKPNIPLVEIVVGSEVELIEIAVLLVESITIPEPLRVSVLVMSVPELQAQRELAREREIARVYLNPPPH